MTDQHEGSQPKGLFGGHLPHHPTASIADGLRVVNVGIRTELRRAFQPPYTTPIVVAVNGLLMAGCWFLLPPKWQDWLFTLHGPVAFAMVLSSWMYSDVPATNVLAEDAPRALAALDDPLALRRLVYSKNLALWLLVAPLCSVLAIIIGIVEGTWQRAVLSVAVIAIVPFGALGLSAWVGVRFPYHPIPLAERWRGRKDWKHMLLRWGILVLTPYGLVPAISIALILPSLGIWALTAPHALHDRLNDFEFLLGVVVAIAVAMVAFVLGHKWVVASAERHRTELAAYLADPRLG